MSEICCRVIRRLLGTKQLKIKNQFCFASPCLLSSSQHAATQLFTCRLERFCDGDLRLKLLKFRVPRQQRRRNLPRNDYIIG
eukprot:g100.t1